MASAENSSSNKKSETTTTTTTDEEEAEEEYGLTPLMVACQQIDSKTHEQIQCILDVDPDAILARSSKTEATPLHYAAAAGAPKSILDLLCDAKVINSFTLQGSTPLHWAASEPPPKNYSETINALIELGADVNAACGSSESSSSGMGIPPLIVALVSGNDIHAQVLAEHGADRGLLLNGNVTAFHIAAELNLPKALAAMLHADNNHSSSTTTTISNDGESTISEKCLKIQNTKGETPLDLAAQKGHLECFKLISGETDEEQAKASMVKIQEQWKSSNKTVENKDNNTAAPIFIDEEAEGKTAAAMLIARPPYISDEDKEKGAEFKSQGNAHFVKGEWEKAITLYTAAIEVNPLDETYYSNRSACYIKLKNKNKEALNDAIICRYVKPKWVKGCYRLSVARLALGRYEDAAVSAWEGLQLDEGNTELETLVTKCIKKGRNEHLQKNSSNNNANK